MDRFDAGAHQELARRTTARTLSQLSLVSRATHHASQNVIREHQQLQSDAYLAFVFDCKVDEMQKILTAITEFINYHQSIRVNFSSSTLADAIRSNIANHIRADIVRGMCNTLNPNFDNQDLLRRDATFGEPCIIDHHIQLAHIPIALTLVTICLSHVSPFPDKFDCAKLIRNWILDQIHNNHIAQRLGDQCQRTINLWQGQFSPSSQFCPSTPKL